VIVWGHMCDCVRVKCVGISGLVVLQQTATPVTAVDVMCV